MAEIARVTAAGIMSDDEPTKTAKTTPDPKEQDRLKELGEVIREDIETQREIAKIVRKLRRKMN
jgi:hypothetical protein